ncbi:MAG TPA: class I SAM-dependent methyltransferase [Isosphaeraceae bacterium]|jgi:ubiquinone/menaquinone biosynthesis C-methylase UbiE|nr:class I SAM-dependent methyltransferase [Isosphaeraceae bacterium]
MSLPVQKVYDRLAQAYNERWAFYTQATAEATLDGLELREGQRVLDLAAGTGEMSRRLRERQPHLELIVGLDISRGMLARGSGHRIQGNASRLPLASETFHQVLCTNAFHMFPRPEATLAEIRRVLRPGGTLTLTDWCDDYLTCKLCSVWLRLTDPAFQRPYTLQACRGMLEGIGFEVVGARKFKINWLWGLMRFEAR